MQDKSAYILDYCLASCFTYEEMLKEFKEECEEVPSNITETLYNKYLGASDL
jgi:hypothetical protein